MHKSKTLRGWRKIGVVAGSLAILAAGAAGASQAFADPGTPPPSDASTAPQPATPKQADHPKNGSRSQDQLGKTLEPAPNMVTGRELTAALYGAVTEIVPGEGSEFNGASAGHFGGAGAPLWRGINGEFQFAPADGSAIGGVSISIMDEVMWGGGASTCDMLQKDGWKGCKLTELPDGSQLVTYHSDDGANGGKQLVAERYVGGIRVWVEANTLVGSGEDATARAGEPVLTLEQLTEIASKPWWSLATPLASPYEDTLPSYEELTSGANG